MSDEYCEPSEDVLHAILDAEWDRGRVLSDALAGKNQSVSRLSVYCRRYIIAIFHRDLDRPGRSPPVATLKLRVATIARISKAHFDATKQSKRAALRVRVDALPNNAAHAEIDGTVSEPLSGKLVAEGEPSAEPLWLMCLFWAARKFGGSQVIGRLLAP